MRLVDKQMKYTAIYTEGFSVGSNYNTLVLMKRVKQREGESVKDMLIREDIYDNTVYLFEGWSPLEGENCDEVVTN